MNIAVILTKDITEGGAFQYAVSVSLLLKNNTCGKYNFIFFTTLKKNLSVLKKHDLLDVMAGYAAFYELENRNDEWRLRWIKSFLKSRDEQKKEIDNLKERFK